MKVRLNNRLWAIKMFFVWRWRLGYWDFDALKSAWTPPYVDLKRE